MVDSNVLVKSDRPDSIAGHFFRPSNKKSRGGIIVLGGSGGGIGWSADVAMQLAEEGYPSLALAYFRWPGLSKDMVRIPLEYVHAAIRWMQRDEVLRGEPIAIVGASRGAELALLAGSLFPEVRAVVANAPSSVVWGAVGGIRSLGQPPWIFNDEPLPWMRGPAIWRHPVRIARVMFAWLARIPWRSTPHFLEALEDVAAARLAAIPVERINGAVLLISGADDQMWPSAVMGQTITDRLEAAHHAFEFRHLSYEGAGHAVTILDCDSYPTVARHPITRGVYDLGGSEEINRQASINARLETMAFLRRQLG